MPLVGLIRKAPDEPVDPAKIPPGIEEKLKRGRDAMREGAPKRNECLSFARGEQYRFVDSNNALRDQATTSSYDGRGKPRHRVRAVRNFIFDIVETEVSAAIQRVPGYAVEPSSAEPRRVSAARLSRKLAYYGYEKWNLRKVKEQVARYAIVADEGFAWPYFDNTVGPYFTTIDEEGNPQTIGQGEICVRVFGPNEVFWEAGLNFEESRWLGIEQARDIDSVCEIEGYFGGKLNPDGQQAETSSKGKTQDRLVLVTEYLERPTAKNPEGRWLTMANGKLICPPRPYPCKDGEGNTLDEPVLHKLTYAEDPDADRDSGLVRHVVDAQRALNHAVSKIAEWINLTLNPQVIVLNGRIKGKLNDEPGAVFNAQGQEVKFRTPGPIPPELFRQKEEAISDLSRIAGQNDIPANVESARGIQALLEKEQARRANFVNNLAAFDSRLMRHCLYLVQRHYTEPRLVKVRGPEGTDLIKDFIGSELLGETDIRVSPDSIEARTLQAIESKILGYADRGWISPHAAMQAINSGTAEGLIDSYERDVARANLIIQKVKEGPEVLFDTQPRRPFYGEDPGIDEETGKPREYVPGWMPRPFDNVKVQRDTLEDWMKGVEYDELEPPQQEALNAVYDAMLQLEAKHQAEEAAAQQEMAESLGAANAAKPQGPSPTPSQAAPTE